MSKSARIGYQDCRAIYQLVGECRELGDDPTGWRAHWVAGLAKLTSADLGHTGEMAGCRDLQPKDLGVVCWGWQNGFAEPSTIETHLKEFRHDPEYCPAMIDYLRRYAVQDGACHSRRQILGDSAWYASADYQVVQMAFNVDHILWCFRTIGSAGSNDCSGIILNRQKGRRDFTAKDLAVVQEANSVLSPLIGGVLARFSDPSPLDLAPRVRQVLACLLEGDSDKQIAARLKLSPLTVNQYTKTVYQHFHVRGRSELLARWVRRAWGNNFRWGVKTGSVKTGSGTVFAHEDGRNGS